MPVPSSPSPSSLELLTELNREITLRRETESMLSQVLSRVGQQRGGDFFQTLVAELGQTLKVAFVLVGRVSDDRRQINTIAVSAHGQVVDNISYELFGTPCQEVTSQGVCIHPSKVQQLYPLDRLLVQMQVESYLGVPLIGRDNATLGLLIALDTKPLDGHKRFQVLSLFSVFAHRAAAEFEHQQLLASLETQVSERTADLEHKNVQLEQTLSELASAEHALVQTERLALIGDLVGGVVDELRAPLTLASTALSCLELHQQRLASHLDHEPLTRSQFTGLVEEHQNSLSLLHHNLTTAQTITERFAHVARKPQQGQRSTVNLSRLFEDVTQSFSHQLGQRGMDVQTRIDGPLQFQGYPGLIAQATAQLLQLALAPELSVLPNQPLQLNASNDRRGLCLTLTLTTPIAHSACELLTVANGISGERQGPAFSAYLLDLTMRRAAGEFNCQPVDTNRLQLQLRLPLGS
ncbi:MAG: GAF domain-containing protein [Gammaproteobacteria bacterium]|nr:GAF domain-containing protein [Gammaproteobacteria bacterium]